MTPEADGDVADTSQEMATAIRSWKRLGTDSALEPEKEVQLQFGPMKLTSDFSPPEL